MIRKTGAGVFALAAAGLLVFANLAQAHHSFAMYDTDKVENFTGKLTRFIPGANHAQIIFELVDEQGNTITDDAGQAIAWGIEMGGSAMIARQGVTVKDFPEGTIINVTLNPLRNGKTFGVQAGPVIKCGTAVPASGCNEETGEVFMAERFRPPGPA